jgi:hypothetical protein
MSQYLYKLLLNMGFIYLPFKVYISKKYLDIASE